MNCSLATNLFCRFTSRKQRSLSQATRDERSNLEAYFKHISSTTFYTFVWNSCQTPSFHTSWWLCYTYWCISLVIMTYIASEFVELQGIPLLLDPDRFKSMPKDNVALICRHVLKNSQKHNPLWSEKLSGGFHNFVTKCQTSQFHPLVPCAGTVTLRGRDNLQE